MHQIIALIQSAVSADAIHDRSIDIDAYCERFAKENPAVNPAIIQDIVLDAVVSFGGLRKFRSGNVTTH